MCLVLRLRGSSNEEWKRDLYLDLARSLLEERKYLACRIPRHNQNLAGAWKHLAQVIYLTEVSIIHLQDLAYDLEQ